ncbi:hypothetical protein ABB37_00013 [Leptomonas pyrrhocoris]|uniref:RING-type domain-containing protein n=1 Tax=Leptomonas pyrrhocoris TaxID=157538 RepID=A0A0N0VHD3_LEPPY|nr:hypothetical protein ABB37_00013 [Leptomonas pyrrhocoris]KPA85604.1 hypothetical protein ABB37_00013 [Leptomonas pyrrhocoris]|eukprot:XP_015664043.1 hypothetical protein ABB37_00013 [Leptomonas pyrrhocoris]
MSKYFEPDTAFGKDAECAVCCCLWTDPVEVNNCQHIFCRRCVEGLATCPVCCGPVDRLNTPGKFILRLLERTKGKCSACAWKGTYKDFTTKHTECLKDGEDVTSGPGASSSPQEVVCMQDYYLEGNGSSVTPNATLTTNTMNGTAHNTSQLTPIIVADTLSNRSFSHVSNAVPVVRAEPTHAQRAHWRQSLTNTARDFGMAENEFMELVRCFPDFASGAADGSNGLELRWRDACRLLRFFNYPNHPDDVRNLFEMGGRSPKTGSIPFNTLCVWLMMNRRNPAQWYHMSDAPYRQILQVAQLLDVKATGLFTLDQCRILAEQYFERDVDDSEWRQIEPLLRSKDAGIRQSFMPESRLRIDLQDSTEQHDVKLPLHDVLCSFAHHVDDLKNLERHSQTQRKQSDFICRIKKIVGFYEPNALPQLDSTLQKFSGEEESLLMTLVAMYGPEPA